MDTYTFTAFVEHVTDADTFHATCHLPFHITVAEVFRVLDFDAPESRHPSCPEEAHHALEATLRARQLLEGQRVIITSHKKGKYGRWLAQVTLPSTADYADTMTRDGFAKLTPAEYRH